MNVYFTDTPLPLYWILLFGVAIAILCVWLEYRKPTRFKPLRMAAALVATFALMMILMRPSRIVNHSDATLVLTPGYDSATADSVVSTSKPKAILRADGASGFPESKQAANADIILTGASSPKVVLGTGLKASILEIMDSSEFQYVPGKSTPGIVKLMLPAEVVTNSDASIAFQHNTINATSAALHGPAGLADSIVLRPAEKTFQLSIHPKVSGNFLYDVTVRTRTGESYSEKVPIVVKPERQLKILFIQKFPTFETQYLKRYLSASHAIVFRYELSRNTFRYDFVNHEDVRFQRLDERNLSKFDLIFLDTDVLSGLSQSEKTALSSSIQKGIGLITIFNGEPTSIKGLQSLLPPLQSSKADTVRIAIGGRHLTLPVWHAAVAANEVIFPVLQSGNRTISAYHYNGFGKMGFSFLQESFRPFLAGDSTAYGFLWKGLIEKTARTHFQNFDIKITSPFPYRIDEPVNFIVTGPSPQVTYRDTPIALKEDLFIDDVWHGTLWPSASGWNELVIKNDSTRHQFFVADSSAWRAADDFNTMIANKRRASSALALHDKPSYEQISLLPFFVLFVIAAAFLWASPKI